LVERNEAFKYSAEGANWMGRVRRGVADGADSPDVPDGQDVPHDLGEPDGAGQTGQTVR